MSEWWRDFFDRDYLRISMGMFTEQVNQEQADGIWKLLGLTPGSRVLDAPCGHGRISRLLADKGAFVIGADQSEVLLTQAESERGELRGAQLRYVRHDLREPFPETGFDAAINVFTSFGYGTEADDAALFRTLRNAVRPGGRVLVETNHRDLMCSFIARGSKAALRLSDGTLFLDEPEFDSIAGIVHLHWYWSGPNGSGEKRAQWRAYTVTEIVRMLKQSGLRLVSAHQGLTEQPFQARGPEVGGRVALIAEREEA